MVQLAILKTVETIGEAAFHIGPSTRGAYPEIEWVKIVGMRNRLVHGYFDVRLSRVRDTVQKDIPRLIAQLELRGSPKAD